MSSVNVAAPARVKLFADLSVPWRPMAPLLARLDSRATPDRLPHLVPHSVPSDRPVLVFEFPWANRHWGQLINQPG